MAGRCSLSIARGLSVICATVILTAAAVSCPSSSDLPTPKATVRMTVTEAGTPRQTRRASGTADPWLELLQKSPFPYTTPLPPSSATILDGIYVKAEPKEGTPVPCRRCPDYLAEGGLWKLSLDNGVFRIFHPVTGWRSLGSFTAADERFMVFNDPACIDVVGVYGWRLDIGGLSFSLIEDHCQVGRRATSFSNMPWQACQPPSGEAASTNHWSIPAGCESIE